VLPRLNQRDLAEVPKELKTGIKFHFVEHMRDVLDLALLPAKPKRRRTES
jgi:ATP-dependent Lon protease